MELTKFTAMLESGQVQDGAILTGDGPADSFISNGIRLFTGQERTHAMQLFAPRRGDGLTPADDWTLAESNLEVDGLRIVANGPMIVALPGRLTGDNSRAVYLHNWRTPPTAEQVMAMGCWWLRARDAGTVYGIGQIALLAGWLTHYRVAQEFYTHGLGRWLPWARWRLDWIRTHPPIPLFREIVCSPAVALAAVAGGMVDIGNDGTANDPVLAWGVTPGDIPLWPELGPEVQVA